MKTFLRAAIAWTVAAGCTTTAGVRVDSRIEDYGRSVAAMPVKAPLLWRIRRGDAPDSFLYGTMHKAVTLERIPLHIRFKLHDARLAFFEWTEPLDTGVYDLWNNENLISKGGDLQYRISGKAWATLQDRTGLEPHVLKYLSPSTAASVVFSTELEMCRITPCSSDALDVELMADARAHKVPLRSLDDRAFLERVQDRGTLTEEELDAWLSDDAAYNASLRHGYEMLEAYKTGRVDAFLAKERQKTRTPAEAKIWREQEAELVARNLAWMEKLTPELTRGKVFVAAGAAHMYGPEGLVELLKKRGFAVEPL
jgi:uncharacterized protein YbaP (TraB family)